MLHFFVNTDFLAEIAEMIYHENRKQMHRRPRTLARIGKEYFCGQQKHFCCKLSGRGRTRRQDLERCADLPRSITGENAAGMNGQSFLDAV